MDLDAALAVLAEEGAPNYRADQVRQAVSRDFIDSWDEASTLPKALRAALEERAPIHELVLEEEQRAKDGTVKARFSTHDGFPAEAVLMRSKDRYTVCLSSQSGCALKCAFCATGTMGLGRSLTKGEIYEQLLWAARTARKSDARIRNVVMMGMGEPLQNLDNVLGFCHLANDPDGFGLGARSIAISTAGWLPGIDALIEEPMQVKLAISLHAPDDVLRTELMPVNKRYPIAELMKTLKRYRTETRRRVYVEYLLLDQVNDRVEQAERLADLLHEHLPGGHHVNLIWYNPTGSGLNASAPERVERFQAILEKRRIPFTLRRSKGSDIDAACGQLAVKGAAAAARAAKRAERETA
ncbi:MAG: 23S rRNA (adenine(2503)-C(2))-methyltransferase RlmN [Thermoleophilia bacterium]